MKILMTNNALTARGGSESYLETVSTELRRLGHEVTFYSPRCGLVAERLRQRGFDVLDDTTLLPDDIDVIHGQHTNAVARVRELCPTVPLVFAVHSWAISVEDPVAELGAGAYVAFNELTRRRLAAHAATTGKEVVRLTQPVEVSFADGTRDPVSPVPLRAVAVSRRMTTVTDKLAGACAELGIDFRRVGDGGSESPDPRLDMLEADIVFAMGRTALEAMAAARAVMIVDESSFGGWVDMSSYPALEADGFTGLGLGELPSSSEPPSATLRELLERYDPELGTQARRLVVRHHAAQHHAAALVDLYTSVADTTPSPVATGASTVAQLAQDRFSLENRAVRAEWEVARLRRQVQDLLAERERLRAQVARLRGRLSRTRERVQRLRRQRDRARAAGDGRRRTP